MPKLTEKMKKDRMAWCVRRLSDPDIQKLPRSDAFDAVRTECHKLFGRGLSSQVLREALREVKAKGLMSVTWLSVSDAANYYSDYCKSHGYKTYYSTRVSLLDGLRKECQRGNMKGSRKTLCGRHWMLTEAGLDEWITSKHGELPGVILGVDDTDQLALDFDPSKKTPKRTRFTVKSDPVAMLQDILQQNLDLKSENEALRSRIQKLEQVEQAVMALSNQLS